MVWMLIIHVNRVAIFVDILRFAVLIAMPKLNVRL
jgi:hypothetical protein